MSEVWKDIKGYEGLYQVSSLGNIKSLDYNHTKKEKQLNLILQQDGYYAVNLMKNGKRKRLRVNRLVASTFLGDSDLVVNHKNGNKLDNRLENLEWCSCKENTIHAKKNRLIKTRIIVTYNLDNGNLRFYDSAKLLAKEFNVTDSCIFDHIKRETPYKNLLLGYI